MLTIQLVWTSQLQVCYIAEFDFSTLYAVNNFLMYTVKKIGWGWRMKAGVGREGGSYR